jgi:hypothetical protein
MNQSRCRQFVFGMAMVFPALMSGCQHLMFWDKMARLPTASEKHPVMEVICLWEQAEGTGLDGLPCRGFAGQLLFFAQGRTPPVRIDGNVRIYVFDDQGTPEEQEYPIHQFDFDAKAFQAFLTNTNIGAAYQLFIPYTRKGGHRATCSLRVRLTPEHGAPVYSKMARVELAGTTSRKSDQPIGQNSSHNLFQGVQLASHVEKSTAGSFLGTPGIPIATSSQEHVSSDFDADRERLRSKLEEVTQHLNAAPASRTAAAPIAEPIHPLAPAAAVSPLPDVPKKKHPLLD